MCGRTMHTQLDKLGARLSVIMHMSSEWRMWRQKALKAEIAKVRELHTYMYSRTFYP